MLDSPVWHAVILGIIQGLTEFLPISSSAHLLLVPWVFGWDHLGLTFDVALHIGTLLAVLIYFRRDFWQLTVDLLRSLAQKPVAGPEEGRGRRVAWAIVIGTLPALVVGGLFENTIEEVFRSPLVTVVTLAVFGLVLLLADRYGRKNRDAESVGWSDGLLIGCAQAVALIPGVSRSGVTITAALLLGLARTDSARFSFLLAGPVVLLAGLKAVFDLWQVGGPESHLVMPFGVGIIVSFITGLVCISGFLRFLQKRDFVPFAVYRFVLASVIFYLLAASYLGS
jgi:undecaprenyl-diphosphatase